MKKYLLQISHRDGRYEEQEKNATHVDGLADEVQAEHPGLEWDYSCTQHDKIIGKKWRPDGTGTDKIIVIAPKE